MIRNLPYDARLRLYHIVENKFLHLILDESGGIRHANHNFCELFGYKLNEIVGLQHSELLIRGSVDVAGYHELFEKMYSGEIVKGLFRRCHKSGNAILIAGVAIPVIDEYEKLLGIHLFGSEISEEALKALQAFRYLP